MEELETRFQRAQEKARDFETRYNAAAEKAAKSESLVAAKEKEKQAVQGELDDLLMVFGDLEDKVTRYKDSLKALGGNVSDAEEDEEGDEEDEDDEDEVD